MLPSFLSSSPMTIPGLMGLQASGSSSCRSAELSVTIQGHHDTQKNKPDHKRVVCKK